MSRESPKRTPAKKKARELAKLLRAERPDYAYLKEEFRYLRTELEVTVPGPSRHLPWVPTEEQVRAFYEAVWRTRRTANLVLIKTFLYTGVRVSELVMIRLADVDLDACQITVNLRIGWCPSRWASVRRWPCTFGSGSSREEATCSSRRGSAATATRGFGGCWNATPLWRGWSAPFHRTSCAISC
ncbi:hypothetical protein E0686_16250 [Deinococcus sp. S9]|nr:hypothetical protein E0686_16250 [Deinococcus sp. S9]